MKATSPSPEAGFTLAEVVIAAGLLATLAAGGAYLLGRAIDDGARARRRTVAGIAALQKMEQLRSLAWALHADTVTSLAGPDPAAGGSGLAPSPPGTLDADVPPYCDYLTEDGALLAPGDRTEAAFVRRWAVGPSPAGPETLTLEVVVTRAHGPARRTAGRPGPDDARLVSLRGRWQP